MRCIAGVLGKVRLQAKMLHQNQELKKAYKAAKVAYESAQGAKGDTGKGTPPTATLVAEMEARVRVARSLFSAESWTFEKRFQEGLEGLRKIRRQSQESSEESQEEIGSHEIKNCEV